MSVRSSRNRQHGWSLVELAVSLAIAALLTVLLFTLLPLGNQILDAERQQQELAQAEQALLGYMRSQGRLPAADSDGDGRADAGSTGPWLPVTDLGLPSRMRIRYQAEPSLIASPGDLFSPVLPPADQPGPAVNTLDFCMRLLLNQRGNVAMAGLGMPVAYYLGHSGLAGHGLADAQEQWNESAQQLPGAGDTNALATLAAGPGELATRLSCPDRLGRAQGSAQGAYAAHSALLMTEFNRDFREFDINIALTVQSQAKVARDLAIYALAEAITNEAIAITMMASGWPPDGVTITAGAKQLATSIKSIYDAGKELKSAEDSLTEATRGVADARRNHDLVTAFRDKVKALYANARDTTLQLDSAGVNQ
ncbi:hypothetical protein OK348_07070 [Flavobacterium sp. MXW15]|uniref:Prepilin-type N-terminal cleavage/methylation domain-containing protein n=1 Tax=Xanthomonas chitinilytica TaxID=2989819 RepID=A0ABT3JTH6_9XANT|nr:hypothetical protein [Xanthomonas sp. H13-6]MCW4454555.1 hypothetical protein [Flavobacterium sp. MXW15]MCW4471794.1 hypothetical protein [Xanthomonas sp. H13-6]